MSFGQSAGKSMNAISNISSRPNRWRGNQDFCNKQIIKKNNYLEKNTKLEEPLKLKSKRERERKSTNF
jgi:hypothetical protein